METNGDTRDKGFDLFAGSRRFVRRCCKKRQSSFKSLSASKKKKHFAPFYSTVSLFPMHGMRARGQPSDVVSRPFHTAGQSWRFFNSFYIAVLYEAHCHGVGGGRG